MKILAALLNFGLLVLLGFHLITDGMPSSSEDIFLCILIFAAPSASLWSLYIASPAGSENILSLYFRRKSLEEKMKIAELQKNKDSE